MSSFIRCPHCAFPLGIYSEFINHARLAYNDEFIDKKYKKYDPEKIVFKPNTTPSLEDIFTSIGMKNPCCRMHITTVVSFDTMYN